MLGNNQRRKFTCALTNTEKSSIQEEVQTVNIMEILACI